MEPLSTLSSQAFSELSFVKNTTEKGILQGVERQQTLRKWLHFRSIIYHGLQHGLVVRVMDREQKLSGGWFASNAVPLS